MMALLCTIAISSLIYFEIKEKKQTKSNSEKIK